MAKILHRIFFNFDDGSDPFLPFLETWKRELPDFQIMEWNKHNLPLDLNTYTRTLAAEKNHAYLSDYFRCWLLREYGGVYLDADIEILDGGVFRRLFEDAQTNADYSLLIGVESSKNGKLTAHSMGVKDGSFHPMLSFLMDLYETAFSGPLHYAIKNFDMPFLMSLYFLDKERTSGYSCSQGGRFRALERVLTTEGMRIYPAEYFSPITTRLDRMVVSSFSPNTCMCHHFAATWRDEFNGVVAAKTFRQALAEGDYFVDPDLIGVLGDRYGKGNFKALTPRWTLKETQIKRIEGLLNFLIPYGSPHYRFLKGKERRP